MFASINCNTIDTVINDMAIFVIIQTYNLLKKKFIEM